MDVLVVTTLLPGARRSGGEIVTQGVVDALFDSGLDVRVLGYVRKGDEHAASRGEHCVGVRPIETRAAGPHVLVWGARALAARAPYMTTKWRSREYLRAIRDALAERPRAVIVDHAGLHSVVDDVLAGDAPFVHLAHNAEAEMYASLALAAGAAGRAVYTREARLVRSVETDFARAARQVWTLTAHDAGYFRSLSDGADVRELPVASALAALPEPIEPRCDVALIGTWSWHANAHGLRWFVDQVLPSLGDLTVEVAGRGADWLRGRHPNVTVRGVVPDAREFMATARVVAVPSTEGGGVQLKTLDAIACGLPVVATAFATRGLGELPQSVAVADEPAAFAGELRRLARDPARYAARDAAIAWSRARSERVAANVASWIGELR